MDQIDWLLAISTLAIGNCFLFATYLLNIKTGDINSYRFLGLFLISLALRIGKSVITLMVPQYFEILTAIGVVAMFAIGPSMFLYFRSSFGRAFNLDKQNLIHFIPMIGSIFFVPFVYLNEVIIYKIYLTSIVQMLVYLSLSILIFRRFVKDHINNKTKKRWGFLFLAGVSAIWICFMIQILFETYLAYFIATLVATAILFSIGLWAMNKQRFFSFGRSKESNDILDSLAVKIAELFEETNVYLKETITVNKIARQLETQPYLVSQAVNSYFGKSLPELVKDYRIQHAKKLLAKGDEAINIKSVAFESGFTTLSSFYTSFRKNTKMTPREFRENNAGIE